MTHKNHLSPTFSGTLRTFAYFMASGSHYNHKGVDYLSLYGDDPSAIEQVFAIYANVILLYENGQVLNAKYAEKRATDYLKAYCNPDFEVMPPYEDREVTLHSPLHLKTWLNKILRSLKTIRQNSQLHQISLL